MASPPGRTSSPWVVTMNRGDDEPHAGGFERPHTAEDVQHRAAEAVQLPAQHGIDLAAPCGLEDALQPGAVVAGARALLLDGQHHVRVQAGRCGAQLGAGERGVLVDGRYTMVDSSVHGK
jgi:hypothetical protein